MEKSEQEKHDEYQEQPLVKRIFFSITGIAILVFFLVALIIAVILFVTLNVQKSGFTIGNIVVVFVVVGLLILVISLIFLFLGKIDKRSKRMQYHWQIQKAQSGERNIGELNENILNDVDMSQIKRPKIVIQEERFGEEYSIKSIIYDKKVPKDNCQICKLEMKRKDTIVQCPICDTFFHKEHLLDWMVTKGNCPVCRGVYVIKN